MKAIEQTKHDGAVLALKRRIDGLLNALTNTFTYCKHGDSYYNLQESVKDAETILQQIKETFAALKEMEPENK